MKVKDLAKTLKYTRELTGLTQLQLAEKLGLPNQVISRLEQRFNQKPPVDAMEIVRKCRDIRAEYYWGEADRKTELELSFKESMRDNMVVIEGIRYEEWFLLKHFLLDEEEFNNCSEFLVKNTDKNYMRGECISNMKAISPLNIMIGYISWEETFPNKAVSIVGHLVIDVDLFYNYFYRAIYDENGYGTVLYQDHVGSDVREVFGDIKLAYEDSLE